MYLKRNKRDFNSIWNILIAKEQFHAQKLRFFVYSPKDQVHIKMQRNKNVLMTIIPNIQWFYFTCFVQ
jgi:hypothetical protein